MLKTNKSSHRRRSRPSFTSATWRPCWQKRLELKLPIYWHTWMGGRTYVVDDVMAIKPKFLVLISYHIFLTMVFRALALLVRGAPLQILWWTSASQVKDCTPYNNQRIWEIIWRFHSSVKGEQWKLCRIRPQAWRHSNCWSPMEVASLQL